MKRQRRGFKQTLVLEERLARETGQLRSRAQGMPLSRERERLIRKAAASHMSDWLRAAELREPK
ncbi:hypothetical protein ACVIGA_005207 [Bradyrhizobium sp. USDA 3240]